ncbi:MAG: DUF805 domain-containing protein [Succinivibrionaceae bacterium]|nr:DUF805 domain-containing protein [Succinivibrionaceae bacterium]
MFCRNCGSYLFWGGTCPYCGAYNPTTGWEDFWTSGGKTKNKENKEKGPPMTDGRIGRAVFWMLELFLMLCFVGIKYAADYLRSGEGAHQSWSGLGLAGLIFVAVVLGLVSFIYLVQRLHDIGLSGWTLAILAAAALGVQTQFEEQWIGNVLAVCIITMIGMIPGNKDENGFGPPGP